jgi:hypothetical protein
VTTQPDTVAPPTERAFLLDCAGHLAKHGCNVYHEDGPCRWQRASDRQENGLASDAPRPPTTPQTEAGRALIEAAHRSDIRGRLVAAVRAIEAEAYDNGLLAAFDDVQRMDRSEAAAGALPFVDLDRLRDALLIVDKVAGDAPDDEIDHYTATAIAIEREYRRLASSEADRP